MLTQSAPVSHPLADICPELAARLGTDFTVIKAALYAELLEPEDLDLTREPHKLALIDHLSLYPDYQASDVQLDPVSPYSLWSLLRNRSACSYLCRQLAADDWSNGLPTNPRTGFPSIPHHPGLLPRELQDVFARILIEHDQPTLAESARAQQWFDAARWPAIETALRSHSARRAAQTRRARTGAAATPKPVDPILVAIQSGDPYKFSRFQLETIDPKRLARVLPAWLEAENEIKAHLVRVPNLPDEVRLQGITAYFERTHEYPPIAFAEPFPTRLVPALSGPTVSKLLLAQSRTARTAGPQILTEPLDPATRQNALFTIALDQPELARWFEDTDTLLAWEATLREDATQGWTRRGGDPESRWILGILRTPTGVGRPLALVLATLYGRWPEDRRRAMASSLLHLKWDELYRYSATP